MKRIGFAALVAAGILACKSDRSFPPGPNALIQDARQNGGNGFFFWLPPIVNQQPFANQVFSKQLRPVVTITNEGSPGSPLAACVPGAVVHTFSGSALTNSESKYQVNWHTDQDNLNANCTYRINVAVAGTRLGYADVDVVNSGKELKNINTQEFIPLLDDRTLPIKFFIGVGSQCGGAADCGEGIARGGENTTIVTTSGRAGVFIPADALDPGDEVAITVESVDDDRSEFECIPNLLQQYPGTADVANNACYDYHAEPTSPGIEQSGRFRFNSNVTVGICPDFEAMDLGQALELLQIFQFDAGEESPIEALNNVPAPFLRCDPHFSPSFGARRSIFGDLARAFASLVTPRPLYASTKRMMFDLGAGGSTDGFSRFTWALPSDVFINFDVAPDRLPVAPGTVVNTLYSTLGVTFSRSNPAGACAGSHVYANDYGPNGASSGQNNISVCPEGTASGFSEQAAGAIIATFTIPSTRACVAITPLGPPISIDAVAQSVNGTGFIEAFDENGESLGRIESTTEGVLQSICVTAAGIKSVRFAGTGVGNAIFDTFYFSRRPVSRID